MPRLFTGLEIPEDVGFALALKRGGFEGARWISPEAYHITLRYIGDVDAAMAREADSALERLSDAAPLDVRLSRLGVFGGNKPRTLYAGVDRDAQLTRLQAVQERALQQIGLPPEGRNFTPHVTLARLRGVSAQAAARFLAEAPPFEPLTFRAERFVLYSARNSIGGGPYVVECAYDLVG